MSAGGTGRSGRTRPDELLLLKLIGVKNTTLEQFLHNRDTQEPKLCLAQSASPGEEGVAPKGWLLLLISFSLSAPRGKAFSV